MFTNLTTADLVATRRSELIATADAARLARRVRRARYTAPRSVPSANLRRRSLRPAIQHAHV